MTREEATEKAKEVFGEYGYVFDRKTDNLGVPCQHRHPRYYVGSGSNHYGNGDTWEDAFANVRKIKSAAASEGA